MSLMVTRQGNIVEALPWVLGANLGTTTTAYFASLNGGVLGKQAALGNLLIKVFGVAVSFPLYEYWGRVCILLAPTDLARQIAHAHTLFNVVLAIIFFPFIGVGVRLVRKLIQDRPDGTPFHFHYLDPRSLDAPELALAQAHREILRVSDLVEKMVERSIRLFDKYEELEVVKFRESDQVVDFLNKGVKLYLTRLSQNEMTPEQVQTEFEFLLRTNDLENIGDIVERNLLPLAKKQQKKGSVFSKEGWLELQTFHKEVVEVLRLSTAYFNTRDPAIRAKVNAQQMRVNDLMVELSEQHVQRLHRGVKETLDTTSIHLDVLSHLQRICDLAVGFLRIQGTR
jgi:phosphate:Na+ symporter